MIKRCIAACLFFCSTGVIGQGELYFSFNQHSYKPEKGSSDFTFSNVSLTEDRFGNKASALFINGHETSQFSLGKSGFAKPQKGTISLWVSLVRMVYTGKGYSFNAILNTRNSDKVDYCSAISLFYEPKNGKLAINMTRDSLRDITIFSAQQFQFNQWTHIAITFDDHYLSLYVNGLLQSKAKKGFRTRYLANDPVLIGHSGSQKNLRFSQGSFDDVLISNRVYSPSEIKQLFDAPNPNKTQLILEKVALYGGVALIIALLFILTIRRYRRIIRKNKENLRIQQRINELEFQVVRAQINPHFLSNSLAVIQDLVLRDKKHESTLYLAKFSSLLRKILEFSDQLYISLMQELETIELYLELEKLRFNNQFNYSIQLDDSIDTQYLKVPSLICQPFVENAIWHGLLPLHSQRIPELQIIIRLKDDVLTIEIHDNGVGRSPKTDEKRNSKGIQLVKDKLDVIQKMQPAFNYSIEILDHTNNNLPTGTSVIIQLRQDDQLTHN